MSRPCTCDRIRGKGHPGDECIRCWLYHNNETYRRLWGGGEKTPPRVRDRPSVGFIAPPSVRLWEPFQKAVDAFVTADPEPEAMVVLTYGVRADDQPHDERSLEEVLRRKTPTAFMDLSDDSHWGETDQAILRRPYEGAEIYDDPRPSMQRLRRFRKELERLSVPFMVFKLWTFDGLKDPRVVPYTHCTFSPPAPLVPFEEFDSRPYDVVVCANVGDFANGPVSHKRAAAAAAVVGSGLTCRVEHFRHRTSGPNSGRPGPGRAEWLNSHRLGRMFLDVGSARPVELGTMALLMKQRDRVVRPFPWLHGKSCIDVGKAQVPLAVEDVLAVKDVLKDRRRLYAMYVACREHTMSLTPQRVASYVLEKIKEKLLGRRPDEVTR